MDYSFKMSMLEVYNETIQDLLGEGDSQPKGGLDVRVDAKKQVFVEGLVQCEVCSLGDVEALMVRGARNR